MSLLTLELEGDLRSYRPGDLVRGVFEWDLAGPPSEASVALVWIAKAGGLSGQRGTGAEVSIERPQAHDRRSFELIAPDGPHSYEGEKLSISWVVELSAGGKSEDLEIVIGPRAEPVRSPASA